MGNQSNCPQGEKKKAAAKIGKEKIEKYQQELMQLHGKQIPAPSQTNGGASSNAKTAFEEAAELPFHPQFPEQNFPHTESVGEDSSSLADEFAPNTPSEYTDSGTLIVVVTAGGEAIPIAEADVLVTSLTEEGRILNAYLRTDRSGKTNRIRLPAPSRRLSLQPENSRPYSVYQVIVDHPQFYVVEENDIQIFGGIDASLPVNLIPAEDNLYPSNGTYSPEQESER